MTRGKLRLYYGAAALALLVIEVCIALFVRDSFVRPYLGDVLAVIFVYCAARTAFPKKPQLLSLWVTGFSILVELIQLTDFSRIFGENSVFSVIVGATFDVKDLLCYAVGGVICLGMDIVKMRKEKAGEQ